MSKMKCCMCEFGDFEHIDYKGVHIYICENCPFIGFEIYTYDDYIKASEWLDLRKDLK